MCYKYTMLLLQPAPEYFAHAVTCSPATQRTVDCYRSLRDEATNLFGDTGDGGANQLVPAVPRIQVHRGADLQSVVLQDIAVENLHAGVGRETEDADWEADFATD